MRKRLLRVYSFITNYRYRKIVKLALARGGSARTREGTSRN